MTAVSEEAIRLFLEIDKDRFLAMSDDDLRDSRAERTDQPPLAEPPPRATGIQGWCE